MDYQTLLDLRKKPAFYNIDPAWVCIDPVPILRTPTYGDLTAPAIVKVSQGTITERYKAARLKRKKLAYKEGFYSGVMMVGEFKGESVSGCESRKCGRG
jgi:leucyl-tRNA synthetase